MKKKIPILIAALGLFALISLNVPNEANASRGYFAIQLTNCNSQEDPDEHVGFSNDCVEGSGNCIDNACNPGSYEKRPSLR